MSGTKQRRPAAPPSGTQAYGPREPDYAQRYGNSAVQAQLKADREKQSMDGSVVTAPPGEAADTLRQIERRQAIEAQAVQSVNSAAKQRVDAFNAMFTEVLVVFGNWTRTQERQPSDPAVITLLVDKLFEHVVSNVVGWIPASAPKLIEKLVKHLGGNMRKSVGAVTQGQVDWAGIATSLVSAQAQLNQGLRNSPYYADFMKTLFDQYPRIYLDLMDSYVALVEGGTAPQQMPGKVGAFLDRVGLVKTSSTLQANALRELMFTFKLEALKQEVFGSWTYKYLPGALTGDAADLAAGGQRRSDVEYRLRKQASKETRALGFGKRGK